MKRNLLNWIAKWSDGLLIIIWSFYLVQIPLPSSGIAIKGLMALGGIPMAWISKSLVMLGQEYESL